MLVEDMRGQWAELDRRIAAFDEFVLVARTDEAARRLAIVPSIGLLNATALAVEIDEGASFGRGRDVTAWLGLVPHQVTTGGKPRLLGISKRGNVYLRKPLIHGARSTLPSLAASATLLGAWLRVLKGRIHPTVTVVALANKLARIAWAALRSGTVFNVGATVVPAWHGSAAGAQHAAAHDVCREWTQDSLTFPRADYCDLLYIALPDDDRLAASDTATFCRGDGAGSRVVGSTLLARSPLALST